MTSLGTGLVLYLGSVSVGKVLPSPNRTATSHPIKVQVTLRDPLPTSAESTCLAQAQPSASETFTSPHATRSLPFHGPGSRDSEKGRVWPRSHSHEAVGRDLHPNSDSTPCWGKCELYTGTHHSRQYFLV